MFKNLKNYYLVICFPFALLLIGCTIFYEAIMLTITRNPHPQINYTIFIIILFGGVFIIINTKRLIREAGIMREFSKAMHSNLMPEQLQKVANSYTGDLACMLQMVASSWERSITHQEQAAIEHELSNTRGRITHRNGLPQYLTGLLVGMGLLGTFIGLLATLNDISTLISSFGELDMKTVSPILVFQTMIERMKAPMQSMGIAFSASMFGLLGSIILGLMMVGIRRLQGDIFSLLTSEVTRHIEIALAHDSDIIDDKTLANVEGGASGEVAKVLLRIEERYAEAARSQQRALSAVIEDLKTQRLAMLQSQSEQTEASKGLHEDLQEMVRQFGNVVNSLEKGRGETAEQLSTLTVQLDGSAKETQKLLSLQVDEQKQLRDSLDSYNISEWLAESARSQQRTLSAAVEDLQQQRTDMQRALTEQTAAGNNSRSDLQQLASQLGNIFNVIKQGNDEISTQISELTVHSTADAKEAQGLMESQHGETQQALQKLSSQLGDTLETAAKGQEDICRRLVDLMSHSADDAKSTYQLLENTSQEVHNQLQQLGSQLGNISSLTDKGNGEICTQISELIGHMADRAKTNEKQNSIAPALESESDSLS